MNRAFRLNERRRTRDRFANSLKQVFFKTLKNSQNNTVTSRPYLFQIVEFCKRAKNLTDPVLQQRALEHLSTAVQRLPNTGNLDVMKLSVQFDNGAQGNILEHIQEMLKLPYDFSVQDATEAKTIKNSLIAIKREETQPEKMDLPEHQPEKLSFPNSPSGDHATLYDSAPAASNTRCGGNNIPGQSSPSVGALSPESCPTYLGTNYFFNQTNLKREVMADENITDDDRVVLKEVEKKCKTEPPEGNAPKLILPKEEVITLDDSDEDDKMSTTSEPFDNFNHLHPDDPVPGSELTSQQSVDATPKKSTEVKKLKLTYITEAKAASASCAFKPKNYKLSLAAADKRLVPPALPQSFTENFTPQNTGKVVSNFLNNTTDIKISNETQLQLPKKSRGTHNYKYRSVRSLIVPLKRIKWSQTKESSRQKPKDSISNNSSGATTSKDRSKSKKKKEKKRDREKKLPSCLVNIFSYCIFLQASSPLLLLEGNERNMGRLRVIHLSQEK